MKNHILAVIFIFAFKLGTAQQSVYKISDSLKNKSYKYLDDKIFQFKNDSAKARLYTLAYLKKSRKEQNFDELVYAYQNFLHQSKAKFKLVYADSMVYTAKKSGENALMGSAYLSKGIVYYGQKEYKNAFDNYIIANNYISRTADSYLKFKVKHQIAQIKYYLGFYDEAISLFSECAAYFRDRNSIAYLTTLHSLALCYTKIGDYDMSSRTNTTGLSESKRLELSDLDPYFNQSEGINEFFKQNHGSSIKKIESSTRIIAEKKDFANESVGYFYLGKNYWALEKKAIALSYFFKVDKIFNKKKYLRPDQIEVYELLIKYYKGTGNVKKQLYYIDQLISADSLLQETYKYLVTNLHKQYDTKELLVEKDQITQQLNRARYYDILFITIILLLFMATLFLTYRNYKNHYIYKRKYEEVMLNSQADHTVKNKKSDMMDIPNETVIHVLKKLDQFAKEKKFLRKNLRLATVAISLNTNSKYLSKILLHYKEKGFVEFINDLKIDYLIKLLKEDKRIRKYTNTALAEEAGFSSTQQFAKAFKTRTGMPTAYFIDRINNE
ncbi:tetratricopeptide repeat protein [Flavobacterium sp. FlaQc-47]|uniref:tetratricopeptide repeat protein n=1 Tax=Flavobacterium sp. FlaQc-47 TaxID=3374180 RepID=UPI0037580BF2